MERVAWTDERLDDLARKMDAGFERVDRDIREVRAEMHNGFTELRSDLNGLRSLMLRMFAGLVVSLLATNLTVLATTVLG